MKCEKCQELVSDFLDGALSNEDRKSLEAHLEKCLSCDCVRQELDSIITYCRDHRGEYDAPPNERALWLRIRNTIESQRVGARARVSAHSPRTGRVLSWFTGLFNRQWNLSLPQMAAAVLAITIGVALITALAMRRFPLQGSNSITQVVPSLPSVADRMKPQQQVIDYLNERVEQRKARWNAHTRETFDRNIQVIDQTVSAYREELQQNPHDEVSADMLDAAMSDKMDLLRYFS
jgi:uncharacterized protein YukE